MKTMQHLLFGAGLIILLGSLTACGGFRYLEAEPLEFHQLDYGFESKFVEINDLRISYIDEGRGDKTIILIHGLASNAGFWRYNIPELSAKNRVIAIDLPGYGKSSKGDFPYGIAWYAEVIRDVIQELNLNNVVYVGHSMGGQIGMTLALNHPDAISQLVLAAPAGIEAFSPGSGNWLRNVFTIRGIKTVPESGIRENLSLNFHRWNSRWEWMVEERTRLAKAQEMDEFAYTVIQCVGAMLDEPTTHRLGDIQHETLLVYGRFDRLIPNMYLNPGSPDAVFEFGHEQIPNSTLVRIDNAGHMVQIEQATDFNQAILNWLSR